MDEMKVLENQVAMLFNKLGQIETRLDIVEKENESFLGVLESETNANCEAFRQVLKQINDLQKKQQDDGK